MSDSDREPTGVHVNDRYHVYLGEKFVVATLPGFERPNLWHPPQPAVEVAKSDVVISCEDMGDEKVLDKLDTYRHDPSYDLFCVIVNWGVVGSLPSIDQIAITQQKVTIVFGVMGPVNLREFMVEMFDKAGLPAPVHSWA